jgi:hypothetical protein
VATLDSYIELYPERIEGYLVRGFVLYASGDPAGAAVAFERARSLDKDSRVAQAFLESLKDRDPGAAEVPLKTDAFQSFLTTLRLEDVKNLKL